MNVAVVVVALVVAALIVAVFVRSRRRTPPAPLLSASSEDRTVVGLSVPGPSSDATIVGAMTAAPDATVVDVRVTAVPARAPRARVTVVAGGSGTHELDARAYQIGRSASADIVLADPSVSGHHATLAPHGDAFALTDLGSTNGTTVDGRAVQGEHVLRGGETIGIGDARLRYERLA